MSRWIEVADGVLVRRYEELDLSVGLVVGGESCLVVDTGGDAGQGGELAAAVREVTPLPWRVVLTHSHFDHSFGTEAFGPCEVWAHARCHADLAAHGAEQREKWARSYRERGDHEVGDRIAAVRLVLPDHLVQDRADLDLGGRRVVLRHFGPAHSDHDLVVHVPDAGAVYAGDLVEHGAPPQFGDAHPQGWPAALDGILALDAPIVLPGHGEPVDRDYVRAQRAELATVARLCREVAAGALSPDQAVARSPYPEEFTRAALGRP
ncbi:MBL fold metallo-hydrolase [Saccharothrix variisporea]|uniref:Glyoxylase-like metal-dependent hydrolase (Beta-lactamase superfamily II) n=1 Tax=Saccharothrix variisporea TaxID=543527 RepID=A0A495WZU9_9PSEU|nr:MBL fold metallo-hydrolase [Saccharothrix variisporea]RKT67150.1 glyoxylase-like metal-dependent hydrolase (beta-lactamase superfamily II) [Saccharothrix variisporea]